MRTAAAAGDDPRRLDELVEESMGVVVLSSPLINACKNWNSMSSDSVVKKSEASVESICDRLSGYTSTTN